MIIRKYPDVNFVKIKFHFFRILFINGLSFSARKHYIHSVVKVVKILRGNARENQADLRNLFQQPF